VDFHLGEERAVGAGLLQLGGRLVELADQDDVAQAGAALGPLLIAGVSGGELWAADERGVHRSDDGGVSWRQVGSYATPPQHLRGFALMR